MPETYTLLKSQKNEVFKILQEVGLEPAHFSWADIDLMPSVDRVVPRLNYLDGKYYFQFQRDTGKSDLQFQRNTGIACKFTPGQERTVQCGKATSWGDLRRHVKFWSTYLKREIEATDFWAEMEKYRISVSLALPEQVRNESIPAYEAEEIANKLQALADKIDELFELNTDQNQFVRSKLNYLAEAAKRQRSMDLVYTSIGVFGTIAMGLALTPGKTRELWQLMKSLIEPFLHLIGP